MKHSNKQVDMVSCIKNESIKLCKARANLYNTLTLTNQVRYKEAHETKGSSWGITLVRDNRKFQELE